MSGTAAAGFVGCLVAAVLMGMSCGTGCSPAIMLFLGSYVFQANGNTAQSLTAFLRFFLGKACAILLVCLTAAALGTVLISEGGYFGKYKLTLLMPLFLVGTGLYMLRGSWLELRGRGCEHCHSGCHSGQAVRFRELSPGIGGFLYGLTPCAPLIILTGYAVTMPVYQALIIGVVFSIACMISPLLFTVVLMKLVAEKMREDVPGMFRVVKVGLSAAVIALGFVTCFTGLEG